MRAIRLALVIATWACLSGLTPSVAATPGPRTTTGLDYDWRFHLGDSPGAQAETFDDSKWRLLDVPHDWSIEGEYKETNPGGAISGWLPTGVAWYRKNFIVTSEMLKQNAAINFDGVFMNCTVWINGFELGTHPYGYISFFYDLTGHLHEGANVVAVRVDNNLQPAARWYTGSGIYGHVRLVATSPTHIAAFFRQPQKVGQSK